MNDRQSTILRLVIDEYVEHAQPVSSQVLCQKYDLNCSPATVRNDMMALEEEGYLHQPHTSAGRVPTEEGYRYFLANFLAEGGRRKAENSGPELRSAMRQVQNLEAKVQVMARRLAELSGDAVVVSNEHQASTLGVGNLLRKPDFQESNMLLQLAEDIERLEQDAMHVVSIAPSDVRILLGEESPMGKRLATVIVRHQLPNGEIGVLSIVGPLRMNYARNVALLEEAKRILEEHDF
jgi:heat-inducible transcriptional repressor